MNRLFPQLIVTLFAAGALLSSAAAQVFDPGPSDPGLFDSVVNIPADVNPLEPSLLEPDTAGGTKQINLAAGGQIVNSTTTVPVESGVELNITGGEISGGNQFTGPIFDFNAGSEANISGGTAPRLTLRGDVGSLINVTGGDYVGLGAGGRISTGGALNMSGGQFNSVSAGVANISGDAGISQFRVGSGNTANFMGGFAGDLTMGSNSTLNLTGGTVGIAGEPTIAGFNVTLDIDGGLFQTILTLDGGSQAYVRGGAVHWLRAGRSVPDQDPLGSQDVKIDVSGGTIGRIEVRSPWVFAGSLPNVATVTGGRVGTIVAENGAQVRVSGGAVEQFDLEAGADVVFSGGEFMLNGAPYTEPSVDLIVGDVFTGTLLDGSPFVYQSGDLDEHITLDTQPVPPADLTPIVVDAPSDLYGLRAGQSLMLRDGGTLRDHFSMVDADLTIEGGAFGVSPLNGRPSKVAGSNILMTGGEVLGPIRLAGGSTFTMTGGTIDTLSVSADSVANISGGAWDRFFGGPVNLFGSDFAINGEPIEDLIPGEPFAIPSSNTASGSFSGLLTDGTPFSLSLNTFVSGGPFTVNLVEPGDFNFDGVVDAMDIDLLADAALDGSTHPLFDLDGDGQTTFAVSPSGVASDSDFLIRTILGSEYGDLDLDGTVDGSDFSTLLGNFGVGDNWAAGDVTGDGVVDGVDFSTLLGYFGFSGSPAAVAVPEPTSVVLIGIAVLAGLPRSARSKARLDQPCGRSPVRNAEKTWMRTMLLGAVIAAAAAPAHASLVVSADEVASSQFAVSVTTDSTFDTIQIGIFGDVANGVNIVPISSLTSAQQYVATTPTFTLLSPLGSPGTVGVFEPGLSDGSDIDLTYGVTTPLPGTWTAGLENALFLQFDLLSGMADVTVNLLRGGVNVSTTTIQATAVPEAGAILIWSTLTCGAVALAGLRRRWRGKNAASRGVPQ